MSLRDLLKPSAERRQAALDAAVADPLIDRLVEATDRRLARVADYRARLRAPVLEARARLAAMIGTIPGPFEVSPEAWSRDEGLKPLFARASDAAEAWSRDEGVRAYMELHPAVDCFGMLGLLQSERRVLGTVQYGDSMQAEVARTTVSFGEPQVLAPAGDEAAVRAELTLRALDYLALRAMERVGSAKVQKRELEKERALLQAQLRLAERRGRGLAAVGGRSAGGDVDAKTVERDLARTVGELEQVASLDLLPALLDELLRALAEPGEHLAIEPCRLTLDAMNFAVAPSPQALTPSVAMLKLASRGPFAVLIARFPRAALRPPDNRLAEADKYL